MRVLLVEDDVMTARGISVAFKQAKIIVDHTDLGEEALEMVRHYDYDVVLVALRLADISGLDVVRRMRSAKRTTPALMLAPDVSAKTKVMAFTAGADDFVITPIDYDELVARLQAIVRRSRGYTTPILRVGNMQVNLDTSEASVDGKVLHLTGKEFGILELLVMRKGITLTKDVFLNHLYGGLDEPEAKIIDVFICKLRKKLDAAGAGKLIATVWGRGYTLRESIAPASGETVTIDTPLTTDNSIYVN